MFSGIVAAVGRITRVEPRDGGLRLAIEAKPAFLRGLRPGESIAVSGACLTVVRRGARGFTVDVSRETLACTTGLDAPGPVNLERALRLGERFGGHLVAGHVDGVAEVIVARRVGGDLRLRLRAPRALARYLARKGSVALDGVSLTVNAVRGREFEVNLIPYTLASTTLARLRPGSRANLEADLLARYAERLLARR